MCDKDSNRVGAVNSRFKRQPKRVAGDAPRCRWAICALIIPVLLLGFHQRASAGVGAGEITFAEMNCAACHQAVPQIAQRLASRRSPQMGPDGVPLTPAWVHDFLLNPQAEKPGNLMPDMLYGLSGSGKNAAAEALTHYLISLQLPQTNVAVRFDRIVVKEGGELFHKVGCVACHAPQESPGAATVDFSGDSPSGTSAKTGLAELATNSIPLGNLAKKYTVAALSDFLRDPLKSRPSGRMPAQRLTEKEATAIAMYLLRDQPLIIPKPSPMGVNYEHFENTGSQMPDFTKLAVSSVGYATNLGLAEVPHRKTTALRFRGFLNVPQDGDYTLSVQSKNSSQLFLDDQLLVENDGEKKLTETDGKIKLKAGEHKIVVTYFHYVGPPVLKVSWAGPGLEKQEIPSGALTPAEPGKFMYPAGQKVFTLETGKIVKGRELFEKHNCAVCHDPNPPTGNAAPLAKLANSTAGCLADVPAAGVPRFSFTGKQRQDLTTLLGQLSMLEEPLTPADQVHRTMTALNCYACHTRGTQGVSSAARRLYFRVNGAADLGEEGAIPPHLNGVGDKLKPQWLEKVLFAGASVRPYMATRMPQFGEANVKVLLAAFQQADAEQRKGAELNVDAGSQMGCDWLGMRA